MRATPERPTQPTVLGPARIALLLVTSILPMSFLCPGGGGTTGGGTGGGTSGTPGISTALKDYTNACLKAIHLDPAKDLIGPWECKSGNALELRKNGKVMDIGKCTGSGCPKEGDLPLSECDYPTWLDNKCYGNSFVQEVPTSNPKVKAVLLCRHKFSLSNKNDIFDDVAIIAHNSGNGETCWFQAEADPGSTARLDGKVHGPLSSQVKPDFWLEPEITKNVYCVKCHDNGPFMNSRWMRNAISLEDSDTTPYKNSTPPFGPPYDERTPVARRTTWPQPVWVKLDKKKDELNDKEYECTYCHKIAAGLLKVDPRPGGGIGGPDFKTCDTWIARSTGTKHPLASDIGDEEEVVYWMPDDGNGRTPHDGNKAKTQGIGHKNADFEKTYRDHVKKLVKCCSAMGKKRSVPSQNATLPDGCQEFKQPCETCPVEEVNGTCPVAVPKCP